jgi:DNA-directed RNA polymerase specialized sigma24 family protein
MTFEEFVAARLPGVLRFTGVLTADRALAEDVVQEVLIRVHARWNRIGAMDRPELYVRKMIVNEFASWRRRSWRLVPAGRGPDVDDRVAHDHAFAHAERAALLAELGKLPGGSAPCWYFATTKGSPIPRSRRCSAARQAPSAAKHPGHWPRCASR